MSFNIHVETYQTAPLSKKKQSDQGLHCLPFPLAASTHHWMKFVQAAVRECILIFRLLTEIGVIVLPLSEYS